MGLELFFSLKIFSLLFMLAKKSLIRSLGNKLAVLFDYCYCVNFLFGDNSTYLNQTYYSFFEKHLQEKKYTKFTKKKTMLLKNNYLNSASFRFYVSNVLDSNNFKTLSFYTYFIF